MIKILLFAVLWLLTLTAKAAPAAQLLAGKACNPLLTPALVLTNPNPEIAVDYVLSAALCKLENDASYAKSTLPEHRLLREYRAIRRQIEDDHAFLFRSSQGAPLSIVGSDEKSDPRLVLIELRLQELQNILESFEEIHITLFPCNPYWIKAPIPLQMGKRALDYALNAAACELEGEPEIDRLSIEERMFRKREVARQQITRVMQHLMRPTQRQIDQDIDLRLERVIRQHWSSDDRLIARIRRLFKGEMYLHANEYHEASAIYQIYDAAQNKDDNSIPRLSEAIFRADIGQVIVRSALQTDRPLEEDVTRRLINDVIKEFTVFLLPTPPDQ